MFIVSVDPGTTTVGISIFGIDDNMNIISRETILIDATKTKYVHRFNNITDYKLVKVGVILGEIINKYKPIAFAVEMPFMNPRMPQAVIPLARSLEVIIGAISHHNPYIPIIRPSPSNIKNAVFAKGNADKDAMTIAVTKLGLCDGHESEHEIDAIAINFYLLNLLKANYMLPYFIE